MFTKLTLLLACFLLSGTSPAAASKQGFSPVSKDEIESVIRRLPGEFHLIHPYLREPATEWKIHKGDLQIDRSFNNSDSLIVDGHLTIKGNYDDYSPGTGMLVVLGDMKADNVMSWGSLAVTGKLMVPGLVYAYYNDFTFEAGEVTARALVVYDKSTHIGRNSVTMFISSDEEQGEADVNRILGTFIPEVLIPAIEDAEGDFSYIYPDYDACQDTLAKNRSVFRDERGAPDLLNDARSLFADQLSAEAISKLIRKDRLLKLASLLREDLPASVQDSLFAEGDAEALRLLGKRDTLSGALLHKIAASKDAETRAIVLEQEKLPRDLALTLSKDPDPGIRLAVVQRRYLGKLSAGETERLLGDPSGEVRAAVVRYQGTSLTLPQATRLTEDEHPEVKRALAQYLADEALWRRYPTLTARDRENVATTLLGIPETKMTVLPALPAAEQEKLLARMDETERRHALYELIRRTGSAKLQLEVANGSLVELKQELAGNLSISGVVQLQLFSQLQPAASRKRLSMFDYEATGMAMNGPEGVIDKLLENPNATPDLVAKAARYCADTRGNAVFCSALTHRSDLSPEVLDMLKGAYFGEDAEDLGLTILLQPRARKDQVVWAVGRWYDDEPGVLDEVASLKKKSDAEFWPGLAGARSEKLREIAARNANTPPERIAALLKDRVEDVRLAASTNPSLGKAVLDALPVDAPLWSGANPNISEERLKELYDWAIEQGQTTVAGDCLEELAARKLRNPAR